jgi:glyceraldehyde-3-phosphate dehydrogenase (NAD(P))
LRVPTPNVSMVDLVAQVEKHTIAEQLNEVLRKASEGSMKGIIKYCDEPLVSSDHVGTNESAIIDAALTMVMGGDMIKIMAWYDNEWGYSQRVVDLAEVVARNWKK